MSYYIKSVRKPEGWYADSYDFKLLFGLKVEEKWPRYELPPITVELKDGRTTIMWLEAHEPILDKSGQPALNYWGRVVKTSKHRCFTCCPDCGAKVPAGRTGQHKCKPARIKKLQSIDQMEALAVAELRQLGKASGLEIGLTGPDWQPNAATRYYAQRGKLFAFGATELFAVEALLNAEQKKGN